MTSRAWLAFIAVPVLWGIPYFFIKVAIDDGVPPVFPAWIRVLMAALQGDAADDLPRVRRGGRRPRHAAGPRPRRGRGAARPLRGPERLTAGRAQLSLTEGEVRARQVLSPESPIFALLTSA